MNSIPCSHCGRPFQSVNGYIKKANWAHAVYFASLQTGHDKIEVGLTLSIGKWWEESAIKDRSWVYMLIWPSDPGSGFEIRIADPEGSRHSKLKELGKKLTCEAARHSPLLDEFFSTAGYVIDHDPAVLSYLSGEGVDISGRICKH